jgi:hypothetical protein
MVMDMNFPHPRRAEKASVTVADYAALIASAATRQAASWTVKALLSAPKVQTGEIDALDSRMAFFAHNARNQGVAPHGAFSPRKFESVINPAGSVIGKLDSLDVVMSETQTAQRGTEL